MYHRFTITVGGKIPAIQYGSIDVSATVELHLNTADEAEANHELRAAILNLRRQLYVAMLPGDEYAGTLSKGYNDWLDLMLPPAVNIQPDANGSHAADDPPLDIDLGSVPEVQP